MAIFRCNGCGHLREVTNDYVGKSVKCPSCKKPNSVHDTIEFVGKLVTKYLAQRKELKSFMNEVESPKTAVTPPVGTNKLANLDLFNTAELANQDQTKPIISWFEQRNIQLEVDYHTIDTRGFFVEVAIQLGENYDTLKFVSNQIKFAQGRSFNSAKIDLSNKSKKEVIDIDGFCKLLYEYSFVTRCTRDKKENVIWLTLQTAASITQFFNGIWAEWFALMKILTYFSEKQLQISCLRSLKLKHSNENFNELDVFFLVGDIPICIECKSGEYRHDLKKYSSLRKRMKLEKDNFLLFAIDIENDQLQAMNNMYDITFVNPHSLVDHIETLVMN